VHAAMSRHDVVDTRHRVVSIKVPHLPVADAQRCRQRGTLPTRPVTALEYGKRRAHRRAILALEYKHHGSQNLGKLPRSGRRRGIGTRNFIFELSDGRRGIVDTQLDEAPPSAHEQSVGGKLGASWFQLAELRTWYGTRVSGRDASVWTMKRRKPRPRVTVQGSGIVLPDNCER
jgi:hypothetical protein